MGSWHIFLLSTMSGWVAMLEADAAHVGQWMLSRPIMIGPLLGLVCGELLVGLTLGILFEMFTLDVPPVGAVMPINGAVAAGCAVLMAAGPDVVPLAAAFPAGLGLGAGHRWIESRVRQWRAALGLRVLESLEADGRVDWDGIMLRGIGTHMGLTALFVYLSVAGLGPLLSWLWTAAPAFSREGLEFGLRAAPGIGLAVLTGALMGRG